MRRLRLRLLLACACACTPATDEGEPVASTSGSGPTSDDDAAASTTDTPATTQASGDTTARPTTGDDTPPGEDTTAGDPVPTAFVPSLVDRTFECKIVSDTELEDPTDNALQTRFNLTGTDLGIPVVVDGVLHVFFGDSVGYAVIWPFTEDPDAVGRIDHAAVVADPTELCKNLDLYVTPDVPSVAAGVDPAIERDFAGAYMTPPAGEAIADYIADPAGPFPNMPGTFEVPGGALATADALYLFYAGLVEFAPTTRMTLGYLARWDTPGEGLPNYQIVRKIDALDGGALGGHFVQIAPVLHDGDVYMFGTGDYRKSPVYLARVPLDALESGVGTELWDAAGSTWIDADTASPRERRAVAPLFETEGVGEISVQYVPQAHAFLALYQRELHDAGGNIVDNRIVLRVATSPEGPWSEALTIVDMADPAFTSVHCCGPTCPGEQILHCESAGLYGAYVVPAIAVTPTDGGAFTLDVPFLVSTWNPYNVVLFSMRIDLAPG